MGTLLHSCVEVHEPITLSFCLVSGVSPGIDVLYGVHLAQRKGVDFAVVCPHWPSGLNGLIFKRNVFDSCVKSWLYFHMYNSSLESAFHWLSDSVVRFKIEVGVCEKFAKM